MTEQPERDGTPVGFRIQAIDQDTPFMSEDALVLGGPGDVLLEIVTEKDSVRSSQVLVLTGEGAILIGEQLVREGWNAKGKTRTKGIMRAIKRGEGT